MHLALSPSYYCPPFLFSSRKLRGRIIGQVLVNLCLSLIGLLVCYLLAQHARYYDNVRGICYAVAALLQYFMLVYLIWVLIETAVLYARLVGSFKSNPRGFIYAMTLIAWGEVEQLSYIAVSYCYRTYLPEYKSYRRIRPGSQYDAMRRRIPFLRS